MKPDLTEHDWNFSEERVPEKELVHCLLWEFLRESETVRKLAKDWNTWFSHRNEALDQTPLSKRTQAIKVSINAPINETYVHFLISSYFGFGNQIGRAWQGLTKAARENLLDKLSPNPAVCVGDLSHASAFAEALRPKTQCPVNPFEEPVQARAHLSGWNRGKEAVLLVFDGGRYDDTAIRAALESLIEPLIASLIRLKGVEPQIVSGSGLQNPNEWRGKLQSLGMARIFARYGVAQLKHHKPNIYESVAASLSDKGPVSVGKKLSAGRRRFEKSFRELLSFEKAPPLCISSSRLAKRKPSQTKGV